MPIWAKDTPKKEYPVAPEGLHQAICCDVVDRGMVTVTYDGVSREVHQIEIRWLLDPELDAVERFMVSRRYTNSLNEKAKLRSHLQAWRGKNFTPEELQKFDLETLVGVNCQVQIVHALKKDGGKWANVSAVVPLGNGMTKIRPSETYVRVKDRNKPLGVQVDADGEAVPF